MLVEPSGPTRASQPPIPTIIMNATHECIDVCNSLLRGELSAIETYTQAIAKFDSDPARSALEDIRFDHEASASRLRDHLAEMGGEAATDSGIWGEFAKAVEGSAKVFGDSAALTALETGEEHGIKEYEEALRNPDVMDEIKTVIRTRLLPALTEHIATLKRLKNK